MKMLTFQIQAIPSSRRLEYYALFNLFCRAGMMCLSQISVSKRHDYRLQNISEII